MDHWKEFDSLIQKERMPINEEYNDCLHQFKTRITDYKVCCMECGLMIFDPKIPNAFKRIINNKNKKDHIRIKNSVNNT